MKIHKRLLSCLMAAVLVLFCLFTFAGKAQAADFGNLTLSEGALQLQNGAYTLCGFDGCLPGDIDGDEIVSPDDAVYLLLHTMFGGDVYPLGNVSGDVDGNGTVNQDDAVYLLLHTMFGPDVYPLAPSTPGGNESTGPKPGVNGTPIV